MIHLPSRRLQVYSHRIVYRILYQKKPRGFIVNVDSSDGPGTHWVAIYLTRDGEGEYCGFVRTTTKQLQRKR